MESKILAIPPIDVEAFRVSMRAAGIEDVVEPTLALFVEESAQLVASLAETSSRGDTEGIRRAAHALKGSAGNVRARELSAAAESLEAAAEAGDVAAATALVELAHREHAYVVSYLAENGLGQ
jgi:HPt (histidine-containing phosphotransfer) domain-containing protein